MRQKPLFPELDDDKRLKIDLDETDWKILSAIVGEPRAEAAYHIANKKSLRSRIGTLFLTLLRNTEFRSLMGMYVKANRDMGGDKNGKADI